jgi:hypothetical protein
MAATATLRISLEVIGNDGTLAQSYESTTRFVPGTGNGKRETVALPAATFTTLTAPTSSQYLILVPAAGATSLYLKSVTGDGGILIEKSSAPLNGPKVISLGASPSIGILNSGAVTTCEAIWI